VTQERRPRHCADRTREADRLDQAPSRRLDVPCHAANVFPGPVARSDDDSVVMARAIARATMAVRRVDESGGRDVVTAYDYPILGLFWTMLFLFFWIAVLLLVFRVFADIIRSRDLSGWAKALWVIFVIFVPFIGVVAYLIVRAHLMSERDIAETQRQSRAARS
jgi:hypothetical protein